MPVEPGTHTLGPDSGTITVLTGKGGAAAKAGHDLVIEVTKWRATLEVGEATAIALTADARSLRVVKGTGGISPLGDEEKAGIAKTIDEEVLKGGAIEFRSSSVDVDAGGNRLDVQGELELLGFSHPLAFALEVGEPGRLTGSARFKQSDWRIKPFSTLFGTLKVADAVEVAIDARVPFSPRLEATGTRSEHDG
jgi:hypothetical protein